MRRGRFVERTVYIPYGVTDTGRVYVLCVCYNNRISLPYSDAFRLPHLALESKKLLVDFAVRNFGFRKKNAHEMCDQKAIQLAKTYDEFDVGKEGYTRVESDVIVFRIDKTLVVPDINYRQIYGEAMFDEEADTDDAPRPGGVCKYRYLDALQNQLENAGHLNLAETLEILLSRYDRNRAQNTSVKILA